MRVLSVLTYYYPHWTGLTAYAQRLAEGLAARGHQVTVLTARHKPELPLEERYNGVDIVRVPTAGRLSRGVLMPRFPSLARRLIREHDVVHLHTPLMESAMIAWLARRAGKPAIFTNHGDLTMPAGLWNQFVQWANRGMMSQALRWSAAATTHSRDYGEHSDFMRPFLQKTRYIYPPIEIPVPQPDQVADLRRRLQVTGAPVVGFAGRFVEEKGFDFLLQAIPLVVERFPGAMFAYAGERQVVYEDFYGRWQHLVDANADHLLFLGLLTDRQQLANFLGMCDVFCLPSRSDCFPSVQIEAMLCGTPTVTADIPGAREAVWATGMGKLVHAQDPQALAEGLAEVLTDPAPYLRTRQQVRKVFDTERTVAEYEELMRELVGQAGAA